MTEQKIVEVLNNFVEIVSKVDLTDSKKINFFSATKMLTLETKHSAFLAWLLDSENEHCLKNATIKKLLAKLYSYDAKPDKYTAKPIGNTDILKGDRNKSEISVTDAQQLCDLANAKRINVYTEKPTYNDKRIDILIDIVDTKTVIVIENKIDSSTHDDQLREYENYVNVKYASYKKKIFIYLTKFGELPYNTDSNGTRGSYNEEWCTIDYGEIRCIIEELVSELKNNAKTKNYIIDSEEEKTLIIILEHYIKMINTSILNTNPVVREKCKELLSNPKIQEALEIIAAYQRIPTPVQIVDYVCEKLGGLREGNSQYWFYTKPMKDYYVNRNENYQIYKLRCVCQPIDSSEESKITIFVDTSNEKNKPKKYTNAQEALLKKCGVSTAGSNPRLISKFDLVLKSERGLEFDELKIKLDSRIDEFRKELDEFTSKYLI